MRKMVAVISLLLCVALLYGCQGNAKQEGLVHDTLRGSWVTQIACDKEVTRELLENIDLYKEEMALIQVEGPAFTKIVTFSDGAYTFTLDVDATFDSVREFYSAVFDALYESRADLKALYDRNFPEMTREEFLDFYGELYGYDGADAMLDAFAERAFDYEAMKIIESGVYTVVAEDRISCAPSGSDAEAGTLEFAVEADTLTIRFFDAEERYSRMK